MDIKIKEKLPDWCLGNEKHDLVLSNDIDSLASCAILKQVKGWEITSFYDFHHVYESKRENSNTKCWVDVAVREGHAFDNHVSKIDMFDRWNPEMVNLNSLYWISREDYSDKYAGSTLLELWSIYDFPLPKTEKGMMLLLAIDVAYKGFFSDKFHDTQKRYLCNILGFYRLYDVIKRHSKEEFDNLIGEYGLNAEIKCVNGKLETRLDLDRIGHFLGLDLSLPDIKLESVMDFSIYQQNICGHMSSDYIHDDLFTLALTYRNKLRYSVKEQLF